MRLRPVALSLLLIAGCSGAPAEGPAELVASVVLDYDLAFFGGLSGIDLGPEGREMTLLLDGGLMIRGQVARGRDGRPEGIRRWKLVPIPLPAGVDPGARGLDTEGLAVTDAGIFVSLERLHEVWRVSADGAVPERLPRHPDFAGLQENASLEAIAADAGGALYTLPERSGARSRPFPVWRYGEGAWSHAFDLPRRGRFLPVGADFGPDGQLYLLERRMPLPFDFATRVRRFGIEEGRVVSEETLLETAPGLHDNLEGLAVWRDGDGAIRLTMVSDDNFSRFQETEMVEYRLPPELEPEAGDL